MKEAGGRQAKGRQRGTADPGGALGGAAMPRRRRLMQGFAPRFTPVQGRDVA